MMINVVYSRINSACLQLQAQVTLGSLGCHNCGQCAKSCARRSLCLCSQSGGVSLILFGL